MPTWVLAASRSITSENYGDGGELPQQAESDQRVDSHDGNKQRNFSGPSAFKNFDLVLLNIDGFYMYENGIRIDKRQLPEFMTTLTGTLANPTSIICLNETKKVLDFPFPHHMFFITLIGLCVTTIHITAAALLSWFMTRSINFTRSGLPRAFLRKLLQLSLMAPFSTASARLF